MSNLKDLLARLGLLCRLESAMVSEIEALQRRVYALEENRKLKDAAILALTKEVGELKLILQSKVAV